MLVGADQGACAFLICVHGGIKAWEILMKTVISWAFYYLGGLYELFS